MRKKLLKTFIGVFALTFGLAIASCNKEKTETSPLEFELRGETYAVVGAGTFDAGKLVIPATYDGKPVTAIGANAFKLNSKIGTVTIPDSVTVIEENAFSSCTNLTEISLGGGVTEIQQKAFATCANLATVTGLDSVVSVGTKAFEWCAKIKELQFTDSLETISESGFDSCKKLETITLGSSLEIIGARAFYNCTALQGLTIPDGAPTDIMKEAFSGCTAMEYVYLGDKVLGIGESAFNGCGQLREVEIGDSVLSIGASAFANCRKVYQITLGPALVRIGDAAFEKCQLLVEVYNRSNLVVEKGNDKSQGGVAKYALYVRKGDEPTRISKDENGLVYYTVGEEKWLVAVVLKEYTHLVIPDDVTAINQYACYNEQLITAVTIGDGCTKIGYAAFRNSYRIEFVKLGKNVKKLANAVFYNNLFITKVVINEKLEYVGEGAFHQKGTESDHKSYEYVFYEGTPEQWEQIEFADGKSDPLQYQPFKAYYAETEPTVQDLVYWHYVDGVPTLWE